VVHAIAECNFCRTKVATAAEVFAVLRNTLRRKGAECTGDDCGSPVSCKRVSVLWFEDERFKEYDQKLRSIDFGPTLK
jgi:hypothetical protein